MSKKTIMWDFDGTLAFHDGLWSGTMKAALDEVFDNHNILVDYIKPFLSTGFPWHEPEKGHPELSTIEAWWAHMEYHLKTIFEKIGVDEKKSLILAKKTHEIYIDERRYQIYPNTISTLDKLKKSGWRNVILSNHVPELPDIVRKLGFANVIDECFTSALIGYEKPNAKIFQYALNYLQNPEICVMVGDSINSDIKGAMNVGIKSILLHTPSANEFINRCNSIAEIEEMLNHINQIK